MAAFTAVQPIADTFLFFIPLYYSAKLAFACYLWANKLQGAELVYMRYVQPFVARQEPMVDRKLAEARSMISDHASRHLKSAVEWAREKAREFTAQAMQAVVQQPQRVSRGQAPGAGSVQTYCHALSLPA
jgi:receptor expression-enhancing protein 1/2/3/4